MMLNENFSYPLNSEEICAEFINSLKGSQQIKDAQNAIVRYFVPSIRGPIPSVQKSTSITAQDIQIAYSFLRDVPLHTLANAPELASTLSEQLGYSSTQQSRICHNLREIVDWARKHHYLPEPNNPIPDGTCAHIAVGLFKGLKLKTGNARQMLEEYLEQIDNRTSRTDLINAVVRFFVPGCRGPIPYHKPALKIETEAALQYLENIPLEYLNEAPSIAIAAMKALNLRRTHQTLVRKCLRLFVTWARMKLYLPDPNAVAPWGGKSPLQTELPSQQTVQPEQCTLFESYQSYRQDLEANNKTQEANSLQSSVIRYLIPAYEGPVPKSSRATSADVQAGLDYLKLIALNQFEQATDLIEVYFDRLDVPSSSRSAVRSRIRQWQEWCANQQSQSVEDKSQEAEPVFNTFYTPGKSRQRKRPGQKMYQEKCPTHALGAKKFPNDYVNSHLQLQINAYIEWRRSNDVTPGSIKTEVEQIYQILGWLHRYEGLCLDELKFECIATKSKLVFLISHHDDYSEYLMHRETGLQEAFAKADQDKQRIERYLKFVGKSPHSQLRRLFVIIRVAEFLYRDVLGTDYLPEKQDIPILRRLLKLQVELNKKSKIAPPSISYGETSVSWEEAVMAMNKERSRADQISTYAKNAKLRVGYSVQRRPDRAIAEDLQRFLSIVFLLLIPSRARTFYELRIGETLKEGILTEKTFQSVEELKRLGLWKERKDQVRFYIHHMPKNYKTGKSMPPSILANGGWWAEIPNLNFEDAFLYAYIDRWLNWGRGIEGAVDHNFFFRVFQGTEPLDGHAWTHRIKTILGRWTGVRVPPKNIRKMLASEFPEYVESAALLLQHSGRMHIHHYDMRHTLKKLQPIMDANTCFIKNVLRTVDSPD
ncbi:MAG: hypothetical protein KME13_22880 [Myxacorys californica WJT36-NPBG1]|nr:hypothetical protein [Myxacorys californica WJT36-NPBG1]